MNQFHYDNLMIVAGTFRLHGEGKSQDVKAAFDRCARELTEYLQKSDTEPCPLVEGEPEVLPPPPRVPTRTSIEDS